jgi:hypothetical protein
MRWACQRVLTRSPPPAPTHIEMQERVASVEREKGQALYQHSLLMTGLGQGGLLGGQAVLLPQGILSAQGLVGPAGERHA